MTNIFFDEISKFMPGKVSKSGSRKHPLSQKIDFGNIIESKQSDWVLNKQTKSWVTVGFVCAIVFVLFVFLVRASDVQILKRDKYLSLARENRIREIPIQPERGVIFDRKGNILVRNKPAFSLELNTQFCYPRTDSLQADGVEAINPCIEVVKSLNEIVEFDLERIIKEINDGKTIILVKLGLSKEEILPIEANIKKYPGLVVVTHPIRDYTFSESFAHVLGYVGLDDESLEPIVVGKSGIEQSYDDVLSGIQGALVVQMDSEGIDYSIIAKEGSLPGKNVTTFLDAGLQKKAYELLKQVVEDPKNSVSPESTADAGAIVAQDPHTGGVLAMVSYPGFDPNKLSVGLSTQEFEELSSSERYPFFNRAVSAAYPPGSTFKMAVASAALMEGTINENTTVFDPGYIQVGTYIFRNWNTAGHGDVNLRRAIQVSNDTYFYTVGGGYGDVEGIGIKRLSEWAEKFGFGSLTGIDIYGEEPGFMPDGTGREWYLGDTYITSIGQGDVLATPLQLNNYVTYFANGGYLLEPHIVKHVDGVGEYEVQVLAQNIVKKEYYEAVREGMNMAVEFGGTGWPLFDFALKHNGLEVAGKTGTSEYIDRDGTDRTHAWFTVFGPYEKDNSSVSEVVLTVFLEGGGGGSDDAAPIASELLDYWFVGR